MKPSGFAGLGSDHGQRTVATKPAGWRYQDSPILQLPSFPSIGDSMSSVVCFRRGRTITSKSKSHVRVEGLHNSRPSERGGKVRKTCRR
jgi:hypothetical protein